MSNRKNLRTLDGPLRLLAGGNLIGAKGIALAFQAVARAKARGVKFHYRLGGGGCAPALRRRALLRPVLRCSWSTTQEVFERVAARPGHGLDLLAKRSFP